MRPGLNRRTDALGEQLHSPSVRAVPAVLSRRQELAFASIKEAADPDKGAEHRVQRTRSPCPRRHPALDADGPLSEGEGRSSSSLSPFWHEAAADVSHLGSNDRLVLPSAACSHPASPMASLLVCSISARKAVPSSSRLLRPVRPDSAPARPFRTAAARLASAAPSPASDKCTSSASRPARTRRWTRWARSAPPREESQVSAHRRSKRDQITHSHTSGASAYRYKDHRQQVHRFRVRIPPGFVGPSDRPP